MVLHGKRSAGIRLAAGSKLAEQPFIIEVANVRFQPDLTNIVVSRTVGCCVLTMRVEGWQPRPEPKSAP